MSASLECQSYPILCVVHEATTLYAELIQAVPERGFYWVRPIALLTPVPSLDTAMALPCSNLEQLDPEQYVLHDLRQGADLLCPQSLFRPALDTEILPVMVRLHALKAQANSVPPDPVNTLQSNYQARHHLQAFIRRIWQVHPERFA